MRYQKCKYWDEGYCYCPSLRNGLNSLECVGSDRCNVYRIEDNIDDVPQSESDETQSGISRIDHIGSNGNDAQIYIVEKIARAICGEGADQPLGGRLVGNDRWTLSIGAATRVYIALWEDLKEYD